MQFGGTPKLASSRRKRLRLMDGFSEDLYTHSLMMYDKPPMCNVTLQEFESYAYDRVKVLHFLDTLNVSYIKHSQEYKDKLTEFLRKNYIGFVLNSNGEIGERDLEWRKKDHVSHFILRLAYCRSEELRRWFIEKEVDLFKYRFGCESSQSISEFLKLNKLTYMPISNEEKTQFSGHLCLITPEITRAKLPSINFYKVPFTEVLNLVATRRVFIHQGFAYVPHSDLISIISTRFREALSKALAHTSRSLPELEEDDRLLPILKGFDKNAFAEAYDPNKNSGKVSIKDIDELARTSFPLCMRQLHQVFREAHHLRHWGRLQYGLFLKGIGITYEDAMKFWREEFAKSVGADKFNKQYAYNVRHTYGKEGKRTNYSPYSCINIITKNSPGPGDHHGCPFKHTSPELLRQRLTNYRVPKDAIDDIINLVKCQHFQIACTKYFEATHEIQDAGFQVNHPNEYFDESQAFYAGEKKTGTSSGAGNSSKGTFVPKWSQSLPETLSLGAATELTESELDVLMSEVGDV